MSIPASHSSSWEKIKSKMSTINASDSSVSSFKSAFAQLSSGSTGMVPEGAITPATSDHESVVSYGSIAQGSISSGDKELLSKTVVVKLNGGLGTSMGLGGPKSLLSVKDGLTFLDLSCLQARELSGCKFMLMNSFSTSKETTEFLKGKYEDVYDHGSYELVQNTVPKLDAKTLEPVEYSKNANFEWCPPGHGDLYATLHGSGALQTLIGQGYEYMFVSNSDNLGAVMDAGILRYLAEQKKGFAMEVCERTQADKKGGHLCVKKDSGRLSLRESAMCNKEDEASFQDVGKHRYFNTNNLWLNLVSLRDVMDANGGHLSLPMIKNVKTVDPKDSSTPSVIQLETAMGAAIESFPSSVAIVVPRTRFAPVKKCSDLLLLRSDAYEISKDHAPVLSKECNGKAPIVTLSSDCYKLVSQLDSCTRGGVPSLKGCSSLEVTGNVWMSRKCTIRGDVKIVNNNKDPRNLPRTTFDGTTVDLTAAPSLGALNPTVVKTAPIDGQKPGTSGLRKKTKVFMTPNYLENFVQSTLNAVVSYGTDIKTGTLVIGGDGRYFNDRAIDVIVGIAVANGVRRIWIGQDG